MLVVLGFESRDSAYKRAETKTTAPLTKAATEISPKRDEAALVLLLLLPVVDPLVTVPEAASARVTCEPPEVWEPDPLRPGPVPAPPLNKSEAPEGMAGSWLELMVTFQVLDLDGQADAPPLVL